MPKSSSYRRDLESQRSLLQEELCRLYGPDYDEIQWVEDTLARLKAKPPELGFSEQDEADLKKVGYALDRRKEIAKFDNPNRDPTNGRFTSGFNAQNAVDHLVAKASDDPPKRGKGKCAASVREAIEMGGIVLKDHGVPAKGFGPSLEQAGFKQEAENRWYNGSYPPNGYTPQKGDVVVIQKTSTSPDGHMAMFDGNRWVSDFKQRASKNNPDGFWPGPKYLDEKPRYAIYRHLQIK